MLRLLVTLLVVSVVAAPVALTLATADRTPAKPDPPHRYELGIAWSDSVFLNRQIAARWLRAHGTKYTLWQTRHPGAAKTLPG